MVRRRLAGALALAGAASLATALVPAAAPAAPAEHRATARSTTVLTVQAPRCAGCKITAHSALTSAPRDVWSQTVVVRDGVATFRVPTGHTRGLSLSLSTPWEGLQGYVTKVAMRYGDAQTGDRMGFARARTQQQATACWAGTTASRATLALGIREVRVKGLIGEVNGTIAWARTTPEWLAPMRATTKGVLGAQSVDYCEG
jgi:hypothetical protein